MLRGFSLVLATTAAATVAATAWAGRTTWPYCGGVVLKGSFGESSGAAGTIIVTAILRNTGAKTCSVRGYPALQLLAANGKPLPTRVTHGGLAPLDRPVQTVVLRPGKSATVRISYSDVIRGSEARCPTARTLLVKPIGAGTAVRIGSAAIGACDHGHLRESPLLAGVRTAG